MGLDLIYGPFNEDAGPALVCGCLMGTQVDDIVSQLFSRKRKPHQTRIRRTCHSLTQHPPSGHQNTRPVHQPPNWCSSCPQSEFPTNSPQYRHPAPPLPRVHLSPFLSHVPAGPHEAGLRRKGLRLAISPPGCLGGRAGCRCTRSTHMSHRPCARWMP